MHKGTIVTTNPEVGKFSIPKQILPELDEFVKVSVMFALSPTLITIDAGVTVRFGEVVSLE